MNNENKEHKHTTKGQRGETKASKQRRRQKNNTNKQKGTRGETKTNLSSEELFLSIFFLTVFNNIQIGSTYESAMTKKFYHGRTECMRPVTNELASFLMVKEEKNQQRKKRRKKKTKKDPKINN